MKALWPTRVGLYFPQLISRGIWLFIPNVSAIMISITQMSLLETASIALFMLNIWSFQELWFYSVDPRRSFSIFPRSIDIITILLLETTREDSPMCVLPQRKYSISSILKIHFGQRKELYAVGAPWAPTADLAESYYYCGGQIALE